MKNNWKYASLGERERLKLIRDGNEDVYKTEKQLNSAMRLAWKNVGIDTTKIDNWDKAVDDAFESSKAKKKQDFPRFMNERESEATNALNKQMKQLRKDAAADSAEAVEKAQKDYDYVSEWLASHGYSDVGSMAKSKKTAIADELYDVLDEISREFEKKSENARATYLARLRSSIM